MFYNIDTWGQCYKNTMAIYSVNFNPTFLGLNYCGKLKQYLSLPPWADSIKLFTIVIYCLSMFITVVTLFYKTEWRYYHGSAVNYDRKTFYNIDT